MEQMEIESEDCEFSSEGFDRVQDSMDDFYQEVSEKLDGYFSVI